MSEVALQTQKAIVEQNLQVIRNSIYNQVINRRVALKVSDKDMEKRATDELVKLEKMRDEFEVIEKEIDVEMEKPSNPVPEK